MPDVTVQPKALIDAIYDGITEVPGWQGFLDAACRAFAADFAAILIASSGLEHPEHLRLFSSGTPEPVQDRIAAWAGSVFGEPERGVTVAPAALGAEPGESAFALLFRGAVDAGPLFLVSLWRTGGPPFGATQRAALESLAPHLERAMRIFVAYAKAYRERAVFMEVIDRIGVGVALVDANGVLMAVNAIGAEILDDRNGLEVRNGKLAAIRPAVTRTLETHIRAAAKAQTDPDSQHGQALALEPGDERSPLSVIVHSGPRVGPVKVPLTRTAIVVMRDPRRRASVSAEIVRALFGLTPAEAALATLLAQGLDLDEAAAELGVRRNTARSQLQSVFQKTDAKRQSELVRMILSSVATLSQ